VNVQALADELLAARAAGRPTTLPPALDLATAWQVSALAEKRLAAAGRAPRGWKIGFTNRTIWPRYGVHQPIWGRVWDDTLTLLDGTEATLSLAGLVAPRLEPEIVFAFARAPEPGMDEATLAGCMAWVAHGIEIVHTHVGWRFDGPAAPVADFGLHGRLLVGPRRPLADFAEPAPDLAALTLDLRRGDAVVDHGRGANVLDGPLSAVRAWLQAMAEQTPDVRVRAGEVVTTGTLTDAWPVAAGETWRTQPGDLRLPGLAVAFAA
jgi:2-oxo-3-hexenedioate decarboxylase